MEPLRQPSEAALRPVLNESQYSGIELYPYGGMEVNAYPGAGGNTLDEEQENDLAVHVYDEIKHSQLRRGLKTRQISMIAVGGALGTGLLIQTGPYLALSGPASMLIGYALVGLLCFVVMAALGEMAAWLPISSSFTGFAARFVDPALGFAVGWNYWFHYIVSFPNNLIASALIIHSWIGIDSNYHSYKAPAIYIALILIAVVTINCFGVGVFGEVEFWLSSAKVLILFILIIILLVIAAGGISGNPPTGFTYWHKPGAFAPLDPSLSGKLGKFLGFWNVLGSAVFSFLGAELVGITIGEAQNPRKAIPRAIKLTFFRIVFFYLVLIFLLGMNVPYNDPRLSSDSKNLDPTTSPFIVAAKLAGFDRFEYLMYAFLIIFTFSVSNSYLYIATRTIYSLAVEGNAPRILAHTNHNGIPIYALGLSSLFGLIAFFAQISGIWTLYQYLSTLVTIFGILTWITILISHIGFVRARRAQNVPDTALTYVSPFGEWGSMIAAVVLCIITLFNGFRYFIHDSSYVKGKYITNAVLSYVGIVIFVGMIVGYKLIMQETRVSPDEADLYGGKAKIDQEEDDFLAEQSAKKGGFGEGKWERIYRLTVGNFF